MLAQFFLDLTNSMVVLPSSEDSHGVKDVFPATNEFWSTQLAGKLLRKEQLELGRLLWAGK